MDLWLSACRQLLSFHRQYSIKPSVLPFVDRQFQLWHSCCITKFDGSGYEGASEWRMHETDLAWDYFYSCVRLVFNEKLRS
jgi:hypothetical protein